MERFPKDIYTEPADVDPDTLSNLGPLRWMAGVWEGAKGVDVHPVASGSEEQAYLERIELQPIDPQTNGPQLLYGLRYHEFIVKPGEVQTFHDQIGYWLWEPASETVTQTLAIPRAQTAMASGRAAADARSFELVATRGSTSFGICSSPFLEYAFRTIEYRIRVVVHDENRWSYDEDTLLVTPGASEPFHHTDRNTLTRIGAATPNPMMRR